MIHRHHRKLRAQGGDDFPPNVIYIPDVLHQWVHANPQEAQDAGLIVLSWQDPAEIAVTIPEELLKKPRAPRGKKTEKPRNRATIGLAVPKDKREDGAGIWDDTVEQVGEVARPLLGLEDSCPPYFFLIPVLVDWLTGQQSIAEQGE